MITISMKSDVLMTEVFYIKQLISMLKYEGITNDIDKHYHPTWQFIRTTSSDSIFCEGTNPDVALVFRGVFSKFRGSKSKN